MATHRADVSVLFGAPAEPIRMPGDGSLGSAGGVNADDDVVRRGVFASTPVRVPDVVLSTESEARADFVAAGLLPGGCDPAPRPVTGRPEVVIRTHPRVGSLVPAGSRVDYELLPGESRKRTKPGAYVDHDVVDTLFRSGRRPMETSA